MAKAEGVNARDLLRRAAGRKRNAPDALTMGGEKRTESKRTSKIYDTIKYTKLVSRSIPLPHVIDSLVELSGIEPLTSSLRTRRSPS